MKWFKELKQTFDVPLVSIWYRYVKWENLICQEVFFMIKNCNNSDLAALDVDDKYYLLIQVWIELTESRTMDSYQYRLMNTLSSLRELNTVLGQKLDGFFNNNHNVVECKSETLSIIKSDQTCKKYYPTIWSRLISHLGSKTETDSQIRALRYQIEYCYAALLPDYHSHLVFEFEDAVNKRNKREVIRLANLVISNCASRGWSTKALNTMIKLLHGSKSDPSKWDTFKQRLLTDTTDTYQVYIPLKVTAIPIGGKSKGQILEQVDEELRAFGLDVLTIAEVRSECAAYGLLLKGRPTDKCMKIETQAYDYFSASSKAISKCSDILSLLSFYNFIEAWSIRNLSWNVVNSEKATCKHISYKDLYGTYDYIESSSKIYQASKNLANNYGSSLHTRLRSSYSYSNMSKASAAQEEQFMNAWVALESLCRTDVYDNIISNVLENVPQALCLRYIYKLYRNFIEDCTRCGVDFNFSIGKMCRSESPKEQCVKEIIAVIKDNALYGELVAKCNVNELLLERCSQLRELVVNPNSMFSRIEKHAQTVRLQLGRLYRLRNEIAHNAKDADNSLLLYIEHLDDYLLGTVTEIVMLADKRNIDTIETIFEIIKDNYQEFLDIKNAGRASNPISMLDSLLETGIINLV